MRQVPVSPSSDRKATRAAPQYTIVSSRLFLHNEEEPTFPPVRLRHAYNLQALIMSREEVMNTEPSNNLSESEERGVYSCLCAAGYNGMIAASISRHTT